MVFISIQEVVYTQSFEIALGYFNYLLQELYYMKKKGKKKKKYVCLSPCQEAEKCFLKFEQSLSPRPKIWSVFMPFLYCIFTQSENVCPNC